ncbi:hypothetical protein [Caldalkalibacillus salinus]|uniref:hypothetical protein n=1 Tax=Caldalkalibacillus salinus TaxID=2803787 RepID=UPI001920A754|nr:hypothetical protein [Caldalkalibacillus salinus]
MAGRLATEYKHLALTLSSEQLDGFLQLFQKHGFVTKSHVFGHGGQEDSTEVVLIDLHAQEIPLIFNHHGSYFKCVSSFKTTHLQLAQMMQQAIRMYYGHATVHRLYAHFEMVYEYRYGQVTQIKEVKNGECATIYSYQDQTAELEYLMKQNNVEVKIQHLKQKVDILLDERNRASGHHLSNIDHELFRLSHELFKLEA